MEDMLIASMREQLNAALDSTDDPEARYNIRQSLQCVEGLSESLDADD